MQVSIHETPDDLGMAVANKILQQFLAAQNAGQQYLLGCPSGRSPKPVYAALASLFANSDINLSDLILVMMDDYVEGRSPLFRYVDVKKHYSCRRFAHVDIAARFNANLPISQHLPPENIWFPDPVNSAAYDERIAEAGGIDLFILASGASDGHIAFNPPGSSRNSVSYVAELAELTREDNLKTFPDFQSINQVPTHGVTVGIATIAELAKSVVMVLSGENKRRAFGIISQATCYDPNWPATIIAECKNAVLFADTLASGETSGKASEKATKKTSGKMA